MSGQKDSFMGRGRETEGYSLEGGIIENRIWDIGYGISDKGRGTANAYILYAIFHILNASAFSAPFNSWIDVKAECGAVGDGKADDTVAIQKGLDLIRPEDVKRKILFFPAGTYRITGTIQAVREKHRESQGIGLQGEGPDQSVLVYDGKGNEPMLRWG